MPFHADLETASMCLTSSYLRQVQQQYVTVLLGMFTDIGLSAFACKCVETIWCVMITCAAVCVRCGSSCSKKTKTRRLPPEITTRYHPVRAVTDIPSLPPTTSSNLPPTRTSSYALYVPRYPPSSAIARPCRRISSVSRTPQRRPSAEQRPPRGGTMLRRSTVVVKGPPATTMRTKKVGQGERWQRRD